MNKIIECPICKKAGGIYLETIHPPHPDQKYYGVGVFCSWCGKIGKTDINIKVMSVKLDTANFIKTDKERIRKELQDAHKEYVENCMGTW